MIVDANHFVDKMLRLYPFPFINEKNLQEIKIN